MCVKTSVAIHKMNITHKQESDIMNRKPTKANSHQQVKPDVNWVYTTSN